MQYQFIKRNFTSNSTHFTEDDNNQSPYKDIDLSLKSKEVADSLPVVSDDLHSAIKFNEEIHKTNYPKGAKGILKVNEIVYTILRKRGAVIDKMSIKLETLKKKRCTRFN